jgi:hypothetical protein
VSRMMIYNSGMLPQMIRRPVAAAPLRTGFARLVVRRDPSSSSSFFPFSLLFSLILFLSLPLQIAHAMISVLILPWTLRWPILDATGSG